MDELRAQLLADRLASFQRRQGGFPIPLAGAVYWAVLAWVGYNYSLREWMTVALWGSGLIFPLALLFAKLFRNGFMKDKTATGDVLLPTFVSMFLFWPMLVAALWTSPALAPLILAIGMSIHWPVIGWSYGKTALYSAHAIVRALAVFTIWVWLPEGRLTVLPLSVCAIYVGTVVAILIEVERVKTLPMAAQRPYFSASQEMPNSVGGAMYPTNADAATTEGLAR
jgi:hypothetical protein